MTQKSAQGRFLRGQKWERYSVQEAHADFYIAPDGCMHKGGDRHFHEKENPFPVWLKLVRHGDTFTGYTSYDGMNWEKPKYPSAIPGLANVMDIGIAAGTIDQIPAMVVLEDLKLEVEDEDWKQNLD